MIGTKAPESGGHSRHPYTTSAFNKRLKLAFSSATYGRESGGEDRFPIPDSEFVLETRGALSAFREPLLPTPVVAVRDSRVGARFAG